ncbi:hypothetical protein [Maricaulis sp.]|uniref:hypothetical protein n=1 Tax=Maricaulis sp. TaxID=1486257 RepID=UPI002EB7F6AA|nr:hypothetical protein [Pseudomonadota bacterium]
MKKRNLALKRWMSGVLLLILLPNLYFTFAQPHWSDAWRGYYFGGTMLLTGLFFFFFPTNLSEMRALRRLELRRDLKAFEREQNGE